MQNAWRQRGFTLCRCSMALHGTGKLLTALFASNAAEVYSSWRRSRPLCLNNNILGLYKWNWSARLWKCMRWKLHGEQTVRFAHLCRCFFFFFFTNLTDVCKCLKKPMKKKDHKQPRRSIKSQPHRCGKHWGTETAEQHLSHTFLLHSQLDVLGDQNCGRKEVELKSA